ncbi:MAG: hypothetical protein ACAH83_16545 [Alphaproteobacteria bacterium]
MRTLICFMALVLFAVSSSAMATQPRKYTQDEKEFFKTFYESCKQAVTAKISEKDFQKTLCFAHIKGSLEAASEISMTFGFTVMAYAEDSCKSLKKDLESRAKDLCAPENLTAYEIAQDYVSYVDSAEYKPYYGAILSSDTETAEERDKKTRDTTEKYYQSPADLYLKIYACKSKQNGKPSNGQ